MRTKNSTSIAAFKANLWNFHNIKGAMHKHRLFYADTELDDDLLPLHYYGINNGSILQLGNCDVSQYHQPNDGRLFPLIILFPVVCWEDNEYIDLLFLYVCSQDKDYIAPISS